MNTLPTQKLSRPGSLSKLIALLLILLAAGMPGCQSTHSTGSPLVRKPSPLEGQPAPQFSLHSDTGTEVSTSDFAGKTKLLLIFYRGYW